MPCIVDLYSFFYAAIPTEGVLTLQDLHTIIQEVWLPRYDAELEEERAQRRKGRPKSTREQKIEELKLRESEEYRTGIGASQCSIAAYMAAECRCLRPTEVIDLTEPANVALFRQWDQKEPAFIKQLRFIRISSTAPDVYVVARYGSHPSLPKAPKAATEALEKPPAPNNDVAMDEDEAPLLLEPTSRFSSTITGMDEIPP